VFPAINESSAIVNVLVPRADYIVGTVVYAKVPKAL